MFYIFKNKIFVLLSAFFLISSISFAENNENDKKNDVEDESHIMLILEDTPSVKPVEEVTVVDIIQNEQTSPELKQRIIDLLNHSQYEIDKYRTLMSDNYKKVESKIYDITKELERVVNLNDTMDVNLKLAKLTVLSLSIGLVCLTVVIILMWRSIVNVNRNDIEVIYSNEKLKKKIGILEKRIELLEVAYKKDDK